MNKKYPLAQVTQQLAAVAMGRQPADTVIKNAKLVNVNTGEIIPNTDVAITHGRIAVVGDAAHTVGADTNVIDATGYYLTPGFMDGHIHVESSMVTVSEYAKAVLPHGTTSIYMDPHEIANVLGMKGIRLMADEGRLVPLRVFVTMPSCVPAVPEFEDAGAILGAAEIEKSMDWDEIVGLGEMMNFPGVIYGDREVHAKLAATLAARKIITGHFAASERGHQLNAYIACGARCCHETVRPEDALAKMRLGMYVQIREGSAWRDLKETIKSITEHNIDTRLATLVSDDTHPHTLINDGHMDHIVQRAIEEGVNPVTAVQMATINVAECFGMSQDLGSVSPGKLADMLLLSDLSTVKVEKVFINGELIAENGNLCVQLPVVEYPEQVRQSVHLPKPLAAEDFTIHSVDKDLAQVTARVIEVIDAKVGTTARKCVLPVRNGSVQNDLQQDVIKAVIIERHHNSGTMGKGFVKGFNLQTGAFASTVAHDSHNLLIIGTNDSDMAFAGNKLAEAGGGMIAVSNNEILALLPLPIAGLMSDQPVEKVAQAVEQLEFAWKAQGCQLVSPFMTMALLGLAVLPELRLTNRGLVDTVNFKFVDLLSE